MPTNKRTRDSRYTKNFGDKPRVGRRYVLNGKVRIEWYEEGKRRSRTIGTKVVVAIRGGPAVAQCSVRRCPSPARPFPRRGHSM